MSSKEKLIMLIRENPEFSDLILDLIFEANNNQTALPSNPQQTEAK